MDKETLENKALGAAQGLLEGCRKLVGAHQRSRGGYGASRHWLKDGPQLKDSSTDD